MDDVCKIEIEKMKIILAMKSDLSVSLREFHVSSLKAKQKWPFQWITMHSTSCWLIQQKLHRQQNNYFHSCRCSFCYFTLLLGESSFFLSCHSVLFFFSSLFHLCGVSFVFRFYVRLHSSMILCHSTDSNSEVLHARCWFTSSIHIFLPFCASLFTRTGTLMCVEISFVFNYVFLGREIAQVGNIRFFTYFVLLGWFAAPI